jgi:hypothetical protein
MEGPGHYATLRPELKHFSAYSTGDMLSEIPASWLNDLQTIYTLPVSYADAKDSASFIARNCHSLNKRETWVHEIMKEYRVDALSTCLHNQNDTLKASRDWTGDKVQLMRKYRFHLSFENQNEKHMTEKLWYALEAGTLPVYMGDSRARRWAPRHSFINAHEFANGVELGRYMRHISHNATLYNSYHAWRFKAPEQHLVAFYKPFAQYHVKCRICQWADRSIRNERSDRDPMSMRV